MAPEDMQYAVQKVRDEGNEKVILTERGVSFGYHTLVVDMRSLPVMRQYTPVIFDVTHSVQQPGGQGFGEGLAGRLHGRQELAMLRSDLAVDGSASSDDGTVLLANLLLAESG